MKKTAVRILLLLLIGALAAGAWFYGYFSRKNLDNIPSKEWMVTYLSEKGEDYATKKIQGYSVDALTTIWGEPDGELFGMYGYIWEAENRFFVVYFDSDGLAESVKLGERRETP